MRSLKIFSFVFVVLSFSSLSASIHLPLQDKNLYRQLEKLMVLSNGSSVMKPYSMNYVLEQLESIKRSKPAFHRQLSSLLKPYQRNLDVNGSLSVSLSDDSELEMVKPNSLGNRNQSNGELLVATQFQFADWFVASGGLSALNTFEDSQFYNTYVSLGFDAIQLDFGYQSYWMSPFQSRAMLNSNNAKQTLSVALHNTMPFEFMDFRYHFFLREMEKQEGILVGNNRVSGRPYILGTHFSFELLEGLTLGLNRSFQFGGRGESVGFSEVWSALIDAAGSDNSGAIDSCDKESIKDCEFGNQRASLTVKQVFPSKIPFSVYGEFAAEDSASNSNFFLGNVAVSLGIYFPNIVVADNHIAITYEWTEYQSAWHQHSIYRDGFKVDGVSSGHWGTNFVSGPEGTAGVSHFLNVAVDNGVHSFQNSLLLHQNKLAAGQSEFPVNYKTVINYSLQYVNLNYRDWQYSLEVGQNYLGESTWSGSVAWQF